MMYSGYCSKELYEYFVRVFGIDNAQAMVMALRAPPNRYYLRVNTLKISKQGLLDLFKHKGFEVHEDELLPDAIYLKVEGPFEVPKGGKVVVADKFAAESVYIGSNLYCPGVRRADPSISVGDEVVILSPRGEVVAWGIAEMDGNAMRARKKGLAVRVLKSKYRAPSLRTLEEYNLGYFYEQSLPSILVSWILHPEAEEVVIDMCAAPGGKTTHMAQLMGNEGQIYAFEKSPKRAERLIQNLRRLGIENVKVIIHDSRYVHVDYPEIRADKILLDPPCSALGVRPKLYETRTLREIVGTMEYQRQFLKAASKSLKKGGYLVYSTCTLTLEENELNIKYALDSLGFKLVEQPLVLGSPGLAIEGAEKLQRFYPHVHDTPGYFIALLCKER